MIIVPRVPISIRLKITIITFGNGNLIIHSSTLKVNPWIIPTEIQLDCDTNLGLDWSSEHRLLDLHPNKQSCSHPPNPALSHFPPSLPDAHPSRCKPVLTRRPDKYQLGSLKCALSSQRRWRWPFDFSNTVTAAQGRLDKSLRGEPVSLCLRHTCR